MKKSVKIFFKSLVVSFICFLMLINVASYKIYALNKTNSTYQSETTEDGNNDSNPPVYILKYPDNKTTKTVSSLQEAQALLDKWELLYTGTTGDDGNIVLPAWATKGEIKIIETVIPEGYTAEETEKIVDLADGEVTFVNKKKEEPKLEQPKEEPKKTTTSSYTIPKTGIDLLLANPFEETQVPEVHVEIQELDQPINNAKDFIIHKVDQDKKPLKGATFEVYGKPVIETTINIVKIQETKHYESQVPDESQVPEEYVPPQPSEDGDNIDNDKIEELDQPNNTLSLEYIQPNVNIVIEGIDNNYLLQFKTNSEANQFKLNLSKGKYKLSEVVPQNVEDCENKDLNYTAPDQRVQFYLQSYEFEIDEKGELKSISEPEWVALIIDIGYSIETKTFTYDLTTRQMNQFSYNEFYYLLPNPISASIVENTITIVNYGAALENK